MDTSCSAPSGGKTVVDKYYGANDVAMSGVTGVGYPGAQAAGKWHRHWLRHRPQQQRQWRRWSTIDVTNPFGHTVLNGPMNWSADASLFKVFPIKESHEPAHQR